MESAYDFSLATDQDPPDFVWTPCLRPNPGDVIADHSFRSPAIILQKDSDTCSLIPDLTFLESAERKPSAMDLDCTSERHPRLSFGLCPWVPRGKVYYSRAPRECLVSLKNQWEYGYHLFLQTNEPARMGFRKTVRLLWDLYGIPHFRHPPGQSEKNLKTWESEYFEKEIPEAFISLQSGRLPGGFFESHREHGADPRIHDAWFNAWYQSVRTAVGVYLEGCRSNDNILKGEATAVVDLILSAPSWGRFGEDRPSGFKTCVNWGTGSAVISASIFRDRFGDLMIDMKNGASHSFDGFQVRNLRIEKYEIFFEFDAPFDRSQPLTLRFLHCKHGAYSLTINHHDLGTFSASEISSGIPVEIPLQ